ncbi:hypothetical protein XAB3213_4660008 [Xanthomonas citri pv. bilvae]|nr:hypothetical protein XAB3213_4660008 [Xanthomonas citri pv. bilvae]
MIALQGLRPGLATNGSADALGFLSGHVHAIRLNRPRNEVCVTRPPRRQRSAVGVQR